MALTYKTPAEDVLNRLTSDEQSRVYKTGIDQFATFEKINHGEFSFAMKPSQREKLTQSGIYTSPLSYKPHSHPVCKTLENHLLYNVLPSYIDNTFFFVGMKQKKFDVLKQRGGKLDMVTLINRVVTSLDKMRYGPELNTYSSNVDLSRKRNYDPGKSDELRNLLPKVITAKARNIFLHDELHYWSVPHLTHFLEVVRPNKLLATFVYPVELLNGVEESLNPWCYTFDLITSSETLAFYPDGVKAEGYYQPIDSGEILKLKRLRLSDGSWYNVDLIHNKFSHSLIGFTAGDSIPQSYRSFSAFDAFSPTELDTLMPEHIKAYPISHDLIMRVYRYLRTLKKPDEQSAIAKLGQIVQSPTNVELNFVEEFSRLVIGTSTVDTIFCPSLTGRLLYFLSKLLPDFLSRNLKNVRSRVLDKFMAGLVPYSFTITLVDYCGEGLVGQLKSFIRNADIKFSFEKELIDSTKLYLRDPTPSPYFISTPLDRTDVSDGVMVSFQRSIACKLLQMFPCTMPDQFQVTSTMMRLYRPLTTVATSMCYGGTQVMRAKMRGIRKGLVHAAPVVKEVMIILRRLARGRAYVFEIKLGLLTWWFLRRDMRHYVQSITENQIKTSIAPLNKNHWKFAMTLRELQDSFMSSGRLPITNFLNGAPRLSHHKAYIETVSRGIMGGHQAVWSTVRDALLGHELAAFAFHLDSSDTFDNPSGTEVLDHEPVSTPYMEPVTKIEAPPPLPSKMEAVQSEEQHIAKVPLVEFSNIDILRDVTDLALKHIEKNPELLDHVNELLQFGHPIGGSSKRRWYRFMTMCPCIDYGHDSVNYQGEPMSQIVEDLGNALLPYGFNTCLIQRYGKGVGIPPHADDERCYNDDEILTVNLSGAAVFKLYEKGAERPRWEFTVHPQQSFVMKAGVQKLYKHSVLSLRDNRISLTYRHHARKIKGDPFQHKISCSIPGPTFVYGITRARNVAGVDVGNFKEIPVAGDGNCFWRAIGALRGVPWEVIKQGVYDEHKVMISNTEALRLQFLPGAWAMDEAIGLYAATYRDELIIISKTDNHPHWAFTPCDALNGRYFLIYSGNHYNPAIPKNSCVLRAISQAIGRSELDILHTIGARLGPEFTQTIISGEGVDPSDLDQVFEVLDINASVQFDGTEYQLNQTGKIGASFSLHDGHLEYVRNRRALQEVTSRTLMEAASEVPLIPIKALSDACGMVKYKPSDSRAHALEKSLVDGTTGILCSANATGIDKILPDNKNFEPRDIITVLGTFGSGKSSLIKKFMLKQKGKKMTFVSPRKVLANAISEELFEASSPGKGKKRPWVVCTFELFVKRMARIRNEIVFLDELQLYPPGYLDIICASVSRCCPLIVAGDPCQSDYDSDKDRHLFQYVDSDMTHMLTGQVYRYNVVSHRFRNRHYVNRLPCELAESIKEYAGVDFFYMDSMADAKLALKAGEFSPDVVLVSGFEEKKIAAAHFTARYKTLTFGESTGLTYNNVLIVVSVDSTKVSDQRWITALSRARVGLMLVNLMGGTIGDTVLTNFYDKPLGLFLTERSSTDELKKYLPGAPVFVKKWDYNVGADEGVREERLVGDPWLKCDIYLGQKEDQLSPEIQEVWCPESFAKTHLPIGTPEAIRAWFVSLFLDKDRREVRIKYDCSNQFPEDHHKGVGAQLTNAAERFEAIYPRHRGNDTVTFLMAIKKRLRFSTATRENARLLAARPYGKFMFDEFMKHIPLKHDQNQQWLDEARLEFEDKKLSKSVATITNHSERSCRDWLADVGHVFMKSQLCTKFDNRFRDAKAGQTIVCFAHSVLVRLAPFVRYIEKKLNEVVPDNFYIHTAKNFDVMNEWVKDEGFSGECTESDYEAFDASQDHYILAFEIEVMQYLKLPTDIISDYVYIKTHLGSRLGQFSIMRFSGEASTFLFNTMANMLFTFLKYDIKRGDAICFAGDDMCANRRLRVSERYAGFLNKMRLKAKVQFTNYPTFCGWCLSPLGIFKRPQLVYERFCIAIERGNLEECLDNYAIEVAYAYRLGTALELLMGELELENHYACVRIIVKNAHKLKSSIRSLYTRE